MKCLVLYLHALYVPLKVKTPCETDFNFTFICKGDIFVPLFKKKLVNDSFFFNFPV